MERQRENTEMDRVDSLHEELARVREEGDVLQGDLEVTISKQDSVRVGTDMTSKLSDASRSGGAIRKLRRYSGWMSSLRPSKIE